MALQTTIATLRDQTTDQNIQKTAEDVLEGLLEWVFQDGKNSLYSG